MQAYIVEVKRIVIQMVLWGIFSIGWACFAGTSPQVNGLILGNVASITYFLLMCYRVKKSVELPLGRALAFMRAGWWVRLVFIVMILVLAVNVPQIDFVSAVVGLFSLYIVIAFNAVTHIVQNIIDKKRKS